MGHKYIKTSDSPVCPICEKKQTNAIDFLNSLSAPARRALANTGIITLKQLSKFSESELLQLYGIGPSSTPKIIGALKKEGLSLRKD
jgi:DNA-directed RNA polymerase alpha subunit